MDDREPFSWRFTSCGLVVLCGLFFFGGLVLSGRAFFESAQCIQARSTWKRSFATIIESEVGLSTMPGGKGRAYQPFVLYQFEYGGSVHRSDSVGVPGGGSIASPFRSEAQNWVDLHPPGSSVLAWVDPDDPNRSALETSIYSDATFAFLLGLPLILVGAVPVLLRSRVTPETLGKGLRVGLFTWGSLGLALHLAAGPISPSSQIMLGGYFALFLVGYVNRRRLDKETLFALRPPPKGTRITASRTDVEGTDPGVRERPE